MNPLVPDQIRTLLVIRERRGYLREGFVAAREIADVGLNSGVHTTVLVERRYLGELLSTLPTTVLVTRAVPFQIILRCT